MSNRIARIEIKSRLNHSNGPKGFTKRYARRVLRRARRLYCLEA